MTDLDPIFEALARASHVFQQGFVEHRGTTDAENPSGETQYDADQWMDAVLFDALADLDVVGTYASEERAAAVDVGDEVGDGETVAVAVDPLDGSSNLGVNNTVGTVAAVYDAPLPASGRDIVGAAFLLYGPMTTMTVAVEEAVERRTIREGTVVDAAPVRMPDGGDVCGISGRTEEWSPAFTAYVERLRRDHKLRYTGTMVADVAHVLERGGLAAYPARRSCPDGVLRLQYESNPIAYVVEQAGGRSSTGEQSILDVDPGALHEKVPSFFGTPELIADLEATLS